MSAGRLDGQAGQAGSLEGRALAAWGLVLLALCALVIMAASVRQLRAVTQSEAQARAQLVADAVAAQVQRAVSIGVPLRKLEGVEALFAQRMQNRRDIEALALTDLDNRVLWARVQGGAKELPEGPRVVSPVAASGNPVAGVVLVWREPGVWSLLSRWLLPVAAMVAAIAALAAEALRYTLARGARLRDAQVVQACERIEAGDFGWRFPQGRRHDFDPRTTWLSAELRHVNELHVRIRRLVNSLRQTEPEAVRRAELDAALQRATADEQFRGEGPVPASLSVDSAAAAARWAGIVLALAAWVWACTAGLLVHAGIVTAGVAAAVAVAGLALLGAPAWRESRRPSGRAFATGVALGALVLGPGLVLAPWLAAGVKLGGSADLVAAAIAAGSIAMLSMGWRAPARPQEAGDAA